MVFVAFTIVQVTLIVTGAALMIRGYELSAVVLWLMAARNGASSKDTSENRK